MWPTNSWHGNVPKAHFFPPILRMTGPLRILLAIIRKGEGGCTCKWMINIKQMNFKMILYLPAEIKCAMVRRWLAVQKIFWFFPPGFTHRAARSQGEVGLVVKILREQICQDSLSWCAEANQLPHIFLCSKGPINGLGLRLSGSLPYFRWEVRERTFSRNLDFYCEVCSLLHFL